MKHGVAQNEAQKQVEIARNKAKIEQKEKAERNADELIAEETAEEIDREMAKILREKDKEEKAKEKEMREELKKLKAKQKNISAKKIQRAFRHTRKKTTKTIIPSNEGESKQPSYNLLMIQIEL